MATSYPCYFESVVTGDLQSPSSLSLEKVTRHFPLQIFSWLLLRTSAFRLYSVVASYSVVARECLLSIRMGCVHPREKASVQDGRDDNDDAGDAQAKQGKPAFGSSEEATIVKVDKKRAVDAQAKEGKAGFESVDEVMEKSKLEQSTGLAARATRSGVVSGYDEDLQLLQGAERSSAKAKGKGKDRWLKVFRCVEDVEDEIARLKKPPRQLKKHNFKTEFGLQDEGDNPHHFCKNIVFAEILTKLFGKPYG